MKRSRNQKWIAHIAIAGMLSSQLAAPAFASRGNFGNGGNYNDNNTATPIRHVILIIGENRTFDHLFGTYTPPKGQSVWNLLSEGILKQDGSAGANFSNAQQWQATDTTTYSLDPTKTSPFATLPQPNTGGPANNTIQPLFPTVAAAEAVEPGLPLGNYNQLTIGGTGITTGKLDTRFPANLPNGPFDITQYISYDDYAGSPVHRFFQMWQELDCNAALATSKNTSGCQNDLFPWVEVTVAAGSNGNPEPSGFIGEGAIAMGVYNNLSGDVPYFQSLARRYTISDNYHQAIEGGTGANHLAIGYGETLFFADSNGNPATPPSNQIENPNPQPGTNNFYTQDGYSGGSYVDCSDNTQPGINAVNSYLKSLSYKPFNGGNCRSNAYYLVNNYNPGYLGTGQVAYVGGPTDFTIPPSQQPNLGLLLAAHNVSWRYYGEGWADGTETGENSSYCNICNPFLYSTQIMTGPLRDNLKDIQDLYSDIQNDTLPAVSIVKPDGYLDGHPASSKFELFESFTKKIIAMTQANPKVWNDTAIMITVDEGGGYYDSGYVQPLDFFGDGTRIPLIVVSPFSEGGRVVHTYYDHVSFDKFVEFNWGLPEISDSSRDNLPNPIPSKASPYVPANSPAIGDLTDMFDFKHGDR